MSFKCKECGEQIAKTGNYTFRILPSKRIPKKAAKLIKSGEIYNLQGSQLGMTKFQQFLLKRSKPTNTLELTCGKCGGLTRISMLKNWCGINKVQQEKKMEAELSSPGPSLLENKKRKKAKKDKTAGLTLPPSLSATVVEEPRATATSSNNEQHRSSGSGGMTTHMKTSTNTKVQRQRELEKLNKILFKSKKAKKSGSTLQDFLSSI